MWLLYVFDLQSTENDGRLAGHRLQKIIEKKNKKIIEKKNKKTIEKTWNIDKIKEMLSQSRKLIIRDLVEERGEEM